MELILGYASHINDFQTKCEGEREREFVIEGEKVRECVREKEGGREHMRR